MKRLCLLTAIMTPAIIACAAKPLPFAPGSIVTQAQIDSIGLADCFSVNAIDDATFARMQGKSVKADCTIARDDLRYLSVLHRNLAGDAVAGEMVVHRDVADDLAAIFRELFDAGYPIERMVLIDDYNADDIASMRANNSSAFNFRVIAGTKRLSNHATGHAVDINTLYNPYVKRRADGSLFVSPEEGRPYADRSRDFDYKIAPGDTCVTIFKRHGWTWGGDWTSLKDYQHFEKQP